MPGWTYEHQKNFSDRVRLRMTAKRMKNKDLAIILDCTPQYVSRLRTQGRPSLEMVKKLAAALDCTVSDLMGV